MVCAVLNSTIPYSDLCIVGVQQMFVELKLLASVLGKNILCLPLVVHRELKKFAMAMWEGKFPKVGDTMTPSTRSLSYHCGLMFLLHE